MAYLDGLVKITLEANKLLGAFFDNFFAGHLRKQ